jgi:hypothetical protein
VVAPYGVAMAMIDAAAAGMLVRVVIGANCIGTVNAGLESGRRAGPIPTYADIVGRKRN